MSEEIIEDEENEEIIEDPVEPVPVETKAKKTRKPRVPRNPYTPRQVRKAAEKKVPFDLENKGTKRIQRTKDAQISVSGDNIVVSVKKGRGQKEYEYLRVTPDKLLDEIKKQMKEDAVYTLDAVRLAVHFPQLYWNAVHSYGKNIVSIDNALVSGGIVTGQRREK